MSAAWTKTNVTGWKKLTDRRGKPWIRGLVRIELCANLALVFCISLAPRADAQQRGQPATAGSLDGKSAQGTLTVTATVVPSVGIVIGPNGEQVIVVANAPAEDNILAAMQTVSLDANGRLKNSKDCENHSPVVSKTGRSAGATQPWSFSVSTYPGRWGDSVRWP